MDADDLLKQAVYEDIMECHDVPNINPEEELRRLTSVLESSFWMIWRESGPGSDDADDEEDDPKVVVLPANQAPGVVVPSYASDEETGRWQKAQ